MDSLGVKTRIVWNGIVYPGTTDIPTSAHLKTAALADTGGITAPLLGVAAGALVPLAMSTFGTVIAGVGTIHAPLAAGGCAAILQASSAALLTGQSAVVVGAVAGASIGAAIAPKPTETKYEENKE
jgi:hypothetical protein